MKSFFVALLNKEIDVYIPDESNTLSKAQEECVDFFKDHQNTIVPNLIQRVFDDYKQYYPEMVAFLRDYAGASEDQIESHLPKPKTADSLLPFYGEMGLVLGDDQACMDRNFGISIETSWTIKGVGVRFENGDVVEVGSESVLY